MKSFLNRDATLPVAHAAVYSNVGAIADPEGKDGATRLLLGLMKRSIVGLSPEGVEDAIDRLGASVSLELTRSVSGLSGSVITRCREQFFELFAKMLCTPAFDESEFSRQKQEAVAQWVESLDNDSTLVRRFFSKAMFADHPYARLASGTQATLGRVTLADVQRLYEELFQERRLIASFAGDVDEAKCAEFSQAMVAGLPQATAVEFDAHEPAPLQGRRLLFVDKPERSQTQIMIGCLGTLPADDDHTALFVGNTIFGGTFSSRLSQEVRGKRGWSYGASSHLPFDRKRQAFSMWTFPAAEDALSCINLQLTLLEDLLENGVTEREVSTAKRYIKNSHPFLIDTSLKRVSLLVDQAMYGLAEDYYASQVARVLAVDRGAVNQSIRRRLSSQNLVITVVGTRSVLLDALEHGIPGLTHCEVVPFDAAE